LIILRRFGECKLFHVEQFAFSAARVKIKLKKVA